MFMQHNTVQGWQEPFDFVFEPSPVWLDDDRMAVDETAKIFLRNILGRSKPQLTELKRDVETKSREVQRAKQIRQSVREGKDKRDEVEVVRGIFQLQDNLVQIDRQRTTAEVETATITTAVGDISIGAKSHNFHSQTFKIPTNCDLCGDRIWGLSAKGFDCKDCGYTCHSKCELKTPADCPGEQSKEEKKKLKLERQAAATNAAAAPPPQMMNGGGGINNNTAPPEGISELPALSRSNTMDTLSSGYAASAHRSVSGTSRPSTGAEELPDRSVSAAAPAPAATKAAAPAARKRIVAPPPTQYISELAAPTNGGRSSPALSKEPRGKMLYAYTASGEGEVSVDEGAEVAIVEADGEHALTFRLLRFLLGTLTFSLITCRRRSFFRFET